MNKEWTWRKFCEFIAFYQDFAGGRAIYHPNFDELAVYSRHSKQRRFLAPYERTAGDVAEFEQAILKQDRLHQYLFLSLWVCKLGFNGVAQCLGWTYEDARIEAHKARSNVYQTLKGLYSQEKTAIKNHKQ